MSDRFHTAKHSFGELCELVEKLRDPVSGCPWDLKQNHQTLAKYLVEEAYEAATALKENDSKNMVEELGDVLFQVILNAQIGQDEKQFKLDDVIQNVYTKMYRRHPHVFGSEEDKQRREIPDIMKRWEEIKKEEKGASDSEPYMKQKGVHKVFPASTQAAKIGAAADKVNFGWDTAEQVFNDLLSEIQELKEEWLKSKGQDPSPEIYEEIGDVYFSLAQVCRALNLEPELVATDGNFKFLRRFGLVEELAKGDGKEVSQLSREEWDLLWKKAKKIERS